MTSLPDPPGFPTALGSSTAFSDDGLRKHYVHWIDKEKGLGFRKTENLVEEELLAQPGEPERLLRQAVS
jgi:hypothetical protein